MSAGFSWNQRNTGGHRPPLQQAAQSLELGLGLRGAGAQQSAWQLLFVHASPQVALASSGDLPMTRGQATRETMFSFVAKVRFRRAWILFGWLVIGFVASLTSSMLPRPGG